MARVTVEDCVDKIPNRFDLVLLARQRVKAIEHGTPLTVMRDNDKNTVVALREIAANSISIESLREGLINRYQRVNLSENDSQSAGEIDNAKELVFDEADEATLLAQLKGAHGGNSPAFDDEEEGELPDDQEDDDEGDDEAA